MAQFLGTTATSHLLEELIKTAKEKLILISPFLKLNDRIKELLEDKNRLKIDIRIIYGKNELQNEEISWLSELIYIRTSFCKNLHAKCYMNEKNCIITSLNLYEFSQVNNNEMGVYISKIDDKTLYEDANEEAQRIIRISEEIRISLEKIAPNSKNNDTHTLKATKDNDDNNQISKLEKDSDKKCPKCDSAMVFREVKNGKNIGNKFWGCSTYPKCKGIINET